jgi:hypothetical protein
VALGGVPVAGGGGDLAAADRPVTPRRTGMQPWRTVGKRVCVRPGGVDRERREMATGSPE